MSENWLFEEYQRILWTVVWLGKSFEQWAGSVGSNSWLYFYF